MVCALDRTDLSIDDRLVDVPSRVPSPTGPAGADGWH
jgi:hypothetical protein